MRKPQLSHWRRNGGEDGRKMTTMWENGTQGEILPLGPPEIPGGPEWAPRGRPMDPLKFCVLV